jgi:hypothetical protein
MQAATWLPGPLAKRHGQFGAALLILGEILILLRDRPASEYYFAFVWLGYALLIDAALYAQSGHSLLMNARRVFLAMLALSVGFWWLFELLNVGVQSWTYVGAESYRGLKFVLFASVDFSLVLVAVWGSARFVNGLLPPNWGRGVAGGDVPFGILTTMFLLGLLALALPILWPAYFFGLLWLSMFLLLDPINYLLGRPSMIAAARRRNWRLPACFALGALQCGFFWEAWNEWSMPRWIYHIPYVGWFHIFQMPLLGWSGYLPFGLELFAMTNFVLPFVGLGTVGLDEPDATGDESAEQLAS